MQLAKIVGNMVASHAHSSVKGNSLFICQPIDEHGVDAGELIVAISPFGGGMGSRVVVAADGQASQGYVKDNKSPLRHCIICVLDD